MYDLLGRMGLILKFDVIVYVVFISACLLFLLDDNGEALQSLLRRFGDRVLLGDELEDAFESLFQEVELHVLRAAGEEEVDFDSMSLLQPFRCLFRFQCKIVFAGADLHLDILHFDDVGFRLGRLELFVLIVLKLSVVHDLRDRRDGVRRDFDEIKTRCQGFVEGVLEGNDPEVLPDRTDDAKLRDSNLMIYPVIYGAHDV